MARRTHFAWRLSAIVLFCWYGFMMVVAFKPDLLRIPITPGAAVTIGVPPGAAILVLVAGGWQMARAALISHRRLRDGDGDAAFYRAKLETARFYADHVLARAPGLAHTVVHGADSALAIEDDPF